MVGVISRNYARALFEVAAEEGRVDAVGEGILAARDCLSTDPEARSFLASRVVGRPAKKRLVSTAFSGRVEPAVASFLRLLVQRGRAYLLPEITEEYQRLARRAQGLRDVTAWSPFPLSAEEQERLRAALEARLGGRVVLEVRGRSGLIGGVAAESEGQEIELSLEGQLKDLSRRVTARRE